jgi:thiamine-monophosphate kinase
MGDVLGDWGEFRLLKEVVIPALSAGYLAGPLGDDCCVVPIAPGADEIILTSDAAPRPLVWELGYECYQTWGWYSVLINASDLAAAGAIPIAFTSSVEAPDSLPVASFRDFFDGMAAACKELGIPNAGGNVRSAPRFECHGTGIGVAKKGKALKRTGCRPGDRICVIGPCGQFISSYLRAMKLGFNALQAEERKVLLRPRPKHQEMLTLSSAGVLSSATDNSDGILGCLKNISDASGCGMEITFSDELIPGSVCKAARALHLDPWNLMFFWGDWQVVASVKERAWERFTTLAKRSEIDFTELGVAIAEPGCIYGLKDGVRRRLRVLRNENFTSSAYNMSVRDHVEWLLHSNLFEST